MKTLKLLVITIFFTLAVSLSAERAFALAPNLEGCLKTPDNAAITTVLGDYPWIAWTHSGDTPYRNNNQVNHRPMVRYVRSQSNPSVCGTGAYFIFPTVQVYSITELGNIAKTLIDSDLDGTVDTYTIKYADNKDVNGNGGDPKGYPIGGDFGATFNEAYNPQYLIGILPKGKKGIMTRLEYSITTADEKASIPTPIKVKIPDLVFTPDADNPTGGAPAGNPDAETLTSGFIGLNGFVTGALTALPNQDPADPDRRTTPPVVPDPEYVDKYRIGPDPTKFTDADWKPYVPGDLDYDLGATPGDKKIYYQFKSNKGEVYPTSPKLATITLVGNTPNGGTLSCTIDPSGTGVRFQITNGANLGSAGTVSSVGTSATDVSLTSKASITSWTETSVTGLINDSAAANGSTYYIGFKRTADNQLIAIRPCTINDQTVKLSIGATVFCKTPNKKSVDNVDLTVYPLDTPSKKATGKGAEKVTMDQDGIIKNIKFPFVLGNLYQIALKAPHGIKRVSAPFTAATGTTAVTDGLGQPFDLFTGDLDDNGLVNTIDRSKLIGAWASSTGATASLRDYDLNLDGPTNSVDFSCMRAHLGKANEADPQTLVVQ